MTTDPKHELGVARMVRANAHGAPGHRTFCIEIEAEHGSARIWIEKSQLSALALTIKRVFDELALTAAESFGTFEGLSSREPSYELRAAALGLAYDDQNRMFGLLAYETEEVESEPPVLSCWITRQRIEGLAKQAMEIVAAGRPLCVLCKQPIDATGHVCIRMNGHRAGVDET